MSFHLQNLLYAFQKQHAAKLGSQNKANSENSNEGGSKDQEPNINNLAATKSNNLLQLLGRGGVLKNQQACEKAAAKDEKENGAEKASVKEKPTTRPPLDIPPPPPFIQAPPYDMTRYDNYMSKNPPMANMYFHPPHMPKHYMQPNPPSYVSPDASGPPPSVGPNYVMNSAWGHPSMYYGGLPFNAYGCPMTGMGPIGHSPGSSAAPYGPPKMHPPMPSTTSTLPDQQGSNRDNTKLETYSNTSSYSRQEYSKPNNNNSTQRSYSSRNVAGRSCEKRSSPTSEKSQQKNESYSKHRSMSSNNFSDNMKFSQSNKVVYVSGPPPASGLLNLSKEILSRRENVAELRSDWPEAVESDRMSYRTSPNYNKEFTNRSNNNVKHSPPSNFKNQPRNGNRRFRQKNDLDASPSFSQKQQSRSPSYYSHSKIRGDSSKNDKAAKGDDTDSSRGRSDGLVHQNELNEDHYSKDKPFLGSRRMGNSPVRSRSRKSFSPVRRSSSRHENKRYNQSSMRNTYSQFSKSHYDSAADQKHISEGFSDKVENEKYVLLLTLLNSPFLVGSWRFSEEDIRKTISIFGSCDSIHLISLSKGSLDCALLFFSDMHVPNLTKQNLNGVRLPGHGFLRLVLFSVSEEVIADEAAFQALIIKVLKSNNIPYLEPLITNIGTMLDTKPNEKSAVNVNAVLDMLMEAISSKYNTQVLTTALTAALNDDDTALQNPAVKTIVEAVKNNPAEIIPALQHRLAMLNEKDESYTTFDQPEPENASVPPPYPYSRPKQRNPPSSYPPPAVYKHSMQPSYSYKSYNTLYNTPQQQSQFSQQHPQQTQQHPQQTQQHPQQTQQHPQQTQQHPQQTQQHPQQTQQHPQQTQQHPQQTQQHPQQTQQHPQQTQQHPQQTQQHPQQTQHLQQPAQHPPQLYSQPPDVEQLSKVVEQPNRRKRHICRFELVDLFTFHPDLNVISLIIGQDETNISYILEETQNRIDIELEGVPCNEAPVNERLHLTITSLDKDIYNSAVETVEDLLHSVYQNFVEYWNEKKENIPVPPTAGFKRHEYRDDDSFKLVYIGTTEQTDK